MKHSVLTELILVALAPALLADVTPVYHNVGTVSNPQIDAQTVINSGIINVSAPIPYETQNTLIFTNLFNGLWSGFPGFRFEYITPASERLPAAEFVNYGEISALDLGIPGSSSGGSYLLISATNITAAGLLSTGPLGLMQLNGQDINLYRCGLRAARPGRTNVVLGLRGGSDSTNYSNVPGVVDANSDVRTNLLSVTQAAPSKGYVSYVYTNRVNPSNYFVQVVFVSTNVPDTNVVHAVRFAPASSLVNGWPPADGTERSRAAVIEFALPGMDITTGTPLTNYVYALDTSAMAAVITNWVHLTNSVPMPQLTTRPAPFEVINGIPQEWLAAGKTNAVFTNTLLYTKDFATDTVTNWFASYTAQIGAPTSQNGVLVPSGFNFPSSVPIDDPTNLPGRLEIKAERLNLDQARIRSEVITRIEAKHLQGLETVQMDVPYYYLNVGSTNGFLTITNLIPNTVRRLSGTLTLTSMVWSNQLFTAVTNAPVDTNNPATPTTNTTDILFHVLLVDSQLVGDQRVRADEVLIHSTNVVLSDNLFIDKTLLIDADNLRVTGQLNLSGQINDLNATHFPHMINLTNDGNISFPGIGWFATDRPKPYAVMVNRGQISGSSHSIWAEQFENNGTISSSVGPISILANMGKFDKGKIAATGDLELKANEFKVQQSTLNMDTLILNITNRFTDSGSTASNLWQCANGFRLLSLPKEGDLLGTQIKSVAPKFQAINHLWSGQDRGPSTAGFTNNAAIGRLILDGGPFSQFVFSGTGTNNALYVDSLILTNNATNISSSISISSNITVYFASANIAPERLDGAFSNHMRWLPQFSGPNSSTNITLSNGQVLTVNRSLLLSTNIDSDADGIVNSRDPNPFDNPQVASFTLTNVPPVTALLTWNAAAQTVYRVDYVDQLTSPLNWQTLTTFTNNVSTNRTVTIRDTIPINSFQRYYRIGYTP